MIEPQLNSFCWTELSAKNAEIAKKFYSGLFGWKYHEEALPEGMGNYITILVNNLPVGAMFAMGMPTHWGTYIRVESLDKAVGKARSLNAKVIKEPFDVMDAGRMAVIQDPEGAFLSLWEKKAHAGAAVQDQEHGATCWHELMVNDPEKALAFYSALLGWTADVSDFGGKKYYSLSLADKTPVGGMMQITPEMNCPPAWSTYFTVADLEEAMDYIKKNGGKVHMGPHEVHGMGFFAICEDAEGAHFSIFEFGTHSHHGGGCC